MFITAVSGPYADSVRLILGRDLDFSDAVSVISPDSSVPPTGTLNYPLYARLGAVAIVQAAVTSGGSLHVALHDVAGAQVANVGDFPLPSPSLSPDWRMALHGVSDEIQRWVTGQRGIAQTRIAFVRAHGVWLIDSDGADARPVSGTGGGLSPEWHPTGRWMAYDEMADNGHQTIVVRDFAGGSVHRIATRHSLNETPAFSPDGNTLVFASGDDGVDLYAAVPFGSDPPHRITVGRGSLNMSPTFSPDGRQVAFTSDRLGHPEVYITDADGTNADLLTTSGFGDQLYRSNPDWSPDGRKVAFQSQINGVFQVMTISVRDRSVQQLTSDGRNEDPSWAPDGRHLVFTSTRTGARQLWVLDTETYRTRQLSHGDSARMPAWSPRLDAARQP